MSIIKIYPENTETFTVLAHPPRSFESSSLGVTGSVYVFPRRSMIEKESSPKSSFIDSSHVDNDVISFINSVAANAPLTSSIYDSMDRYFDLVNDQSVSSRKFKSHNILRFVPTTEYTTETSRKLIVKDILGSFYRVKYPTNQWNYTNYNCLNFFTSSNTPSNAVLLYPNIFSSYDVDDGFTFEFRINPRHRSNDTTYTDGLGVVHPGTTFNAGTIFHLSSSYAVSLISGSLLDASGRTEGFRIQLQLSHSANISPSRASFGGYPNNLTFVSDDNSLLYNQWHRVVIRWGGRTVDVGSGSFLIDYGDGNGLVSKGTFNVYSSSLANTNVIPEALCVGNFYHGSNSGLNAQALWFSLDPSTREGLALLIGTPSVDGPISPSFTHPLNADIHDLSISSRFKSDYELLQCANTTPSDLSTYSFYLGPLFLRESPIRRFYGTSGGVMQTPFFTLDGTTTDPFNVALSFGVGGHDINLENFVKDLANDIDPRCLNLTASAIDVTTDAESANEFLWKQPGCVKRNMLLMPCDDGNFSPNFNLVVSRPIDPLSASVPNNSLVVDDGLSCCKFVDALGNLDPSVIDLANMVTSDSSLSNFDSVTLDSSGNDIRTNEWTQELVGPTPETLYTSAGSALARHSKEISASLDAGTFSRSDQNAAPYTIYQRTKDGSSNEVVFFDVSNLYYGNRILPKSLTIVDSNLSGSTGLQSITLKDDGYGGLYRADCKGTVATWNNVGNVFYDEGIIVVKSPHLFKFGEQQFKLDFKGEHSVHVKTISVLAAANTVNSSSNPSFKVLSASLYHNDNDREFVYISGINFHDENLNVVMRTQLAQPILKRHGDSVMFRVKTDF